MACDICGKLDPNLTPLLSQYRTKEIENVCPGCGREVNDQLEKLQDITFKMNEHWLKKFMKNLKRKHFRKAAPEE